MRRPTTMVVFLLLGGCASKSPPEPSLHSETGVASWYGVPFHGRKTANGEVYDMEQLTAAHRTLPFGAIVRVQYLANGRKVEVRVNDRGPFVAGRIIDLSHRASQTIGIAGVGEVRLDVLRVPVTRAADVFGVQTGEFADREEADQLREKMQAEYGTARLLRRDGDEMWRVLVGFEPTIEGANALASRMGREAGPSFVVRIDEN